MTLFTETRYPPRLLVVQRLSLSHSLLKSRSIGARFGPLLDYMERHGLLHWQEILETEIGIDDLHQHDAVLLNKHSSSRGLEIIQMAKALGRVCIYDLDDWILDLPSYSVTNLDDDVLANIVRMIREADAVSVSNPVLQNKLKYIRPTSVILKNGFDHEALPYNPANSTESSRPRILFSNTDGIKLVSHRKKFLQQLVAFMETHPEVQLDFWGDHFPEITRIPRLTDKGFAPNKIYKEAIRDTGYWFAVVPLGGPEDADTLFFNSCKSCIKYIDYGSLGIPGLYSQSPVYSEAVRHGETGLLVNNRGDEWLQAMSTLYEDEGLRQQIRERSHKDCVANFGLHSSANRLLDLISRK